jgi:hypothetical protein
MKAPSRNIPSSLKGQKPGGRSGESIEVSGLKRGDSMQVPGEGSVQSPPGSQINGRQERSAANYAGPGGKVR